MNYRTIFIEAISDEENHLEHHGVDGQRWGVKHGPPYPLDDNAAVQAARKAASKAQSAANMAKGRAKKAVRETIKTGEGWVKSGKAILRSLKSSSAARKANKSYNRTYENEMEKHRAEQAEKEAAERKAAEAKAAEEARVAEESRKDEEARIAEEKSKSEAEAYKKNVIDTGNISEVYKNPSKFTDQEIGETIFRYQKLTELSKLMEASQPKAPEEKKVVDEFVQNLINKGDVQGAVKNADRLTVEQMNEVVRKREAIKAAESATDKKVGETLNRAANKLNDIERSAGYIIGLTNKGVQAYNIVASLYNQSDSGSKKPWKILKLGGGGDNQKKKN